MNYTILDQKKVEFFFPTAALPASGSTGLISACMAPQKNARKYNKILNWKNTSLECIRLVPTYHFTKKGETIATPSQNFNK